MNIVKTVAGTSRSVLIVALTGFLLFPLVALAKVNINTAGNSELQTLTGIGEVKAEAIIDYRNNNGNFTAISQIKNVSGIGDATYDNIKNDITVGEVSGGDEETNDSGSSEDNKSGSGADSEEEEKKPVNDLKITAPQVAFVNQPIEFDAEPVSGTDGRLVRYSWNFGDTNISDNKTPIHSYKYPGTYVVIVESYYLKKRVTGRTEIKILPTQLVITRNLNGSVTVSNNAKEEINLAGIKITGSKVFEFPPHSVLLPGGSLTIPASKIGNGNTVTLTDQAGIVLDRVGSVQSESVPTTVTTKTFIPRSQVASIETTAVNEAGVEEELSATSSDEVSEMTRVAAVGAADRHRDTIPASSWPYLGLIGILSVALGAIYLSKSNS